MKIISVDCRIRRSIAFFRHKIFVALILCLIVGCDKQSETQNNMNATKPTLKIAVFADGRLTVDGAISTIPKLKESLKRLKEQQGVVWYYRESSQKNPPPIAMEVMQSIVEIQLPIRMSSHSDYSDSIGPDGKPIIQ